MQQDALMNLGESLGIDDKIENYPRLKEIREIRNVSIGHPTKHNRKRHLTRSSLEWKSWWPFSLIWVILLKKYMRRFGVAITMCLDYTGYRPFKRGYGIFSIP
jgi:hypothetical protein